MDQCAPVTRREQPTMKRAVKVISALLAAAGLLALTTGTPVVTSVVDCDPNLTFLTQEVSHVARNSSEYRRPATVVGNSIIPGTTFVESSRQISQQDSSLVSTNSNTPSAECLSLPKVPAFSKITCSIGGVGSCQATCNNNYQFPNGENTMYMSCEMGAWKVHGADWTSLPPCKPICPGGCLNEGFCAAPNRCACTPDFTGTRCELEDRQCNTFPKTPMNSRKQCSSRNCSIKCLGGAHFPGGYSELEFTCRNGNWASNKNVDWQNIPNCDFACDPPCQNGGKCLSFNRCQCPMEFRGLQCQYSSDRCSLRNMQFNGNRVCNGTSEFFTCSLSCPYGTTFTYPPAARYTCYYQSGTFSPSNVPQCQLIPSQQYMGAGHGG